MTTAEKLTGLGAAASIFLTSFGSVFASVQGGLYALKSSAGWKSFIPITQAGVLAIYGIIVAVLLSFKLQDKEMTEADGYSNLSAGLSVGFACLASGLGMGKFVDQVIKQHEKPAVRRDEKTKPLISAADAPPPTVLAPPPVKFIMCMIFLEAIGLYGLIAALFLMNT